MLYSLKWRRGETFEWGGGVVLGSGAQRTIKISSSVPYLSLPVNTNVLCRSRALLNEVIRLSGSCSVESTHTGFAEAILYGVKKKKKDYTVNTYCSALLYEIS